MLVKTTFASAAFLAYQKEFKFCLGQNFLELYLKISEPKSKDMGIVKIVIDWIEQCQ